MRGQGPYSYKKFTGNLPRVSPKAAKTCFVFCHQYNADFRPLISHRLLTAFDTQDVNRCPHAYTAKLSLFPISAHGVLQVSQTTKYGYFREVFVIRLQLKRHNFGQWESFRSLVDIPTMCFLWVSFGGDVRFGRYKLKKTTNFGDI